MEIDGYEFACNLSLNEAQWSLLIVNREPIVGNDAMWHYMITGQVLEGDKIERTITETEETTDL